MGPATGWGRVWLRSSPDPLVTNWMNSDSRSPPALGTRCKRFMGDTTLKVPSSFRSSFLTSPALVFHVPMLPTAIVTPKPGACFPQATQCLVPPPSYRSGPQGAVTTSPRPSGETEVWDDRPLLGTPAASRPFYVLKGTVPLPSPGEAGKRPVFMSHSPSTEQDGILGKGLDESVSTLNYSGSRQTEPTTVELVKREAPFWEPCVPFCCVLAQPLDKLPA